MCNFMCIFFSKRKDLSVFNAVMFKRVVVMFKILFLPLKSR